MKLTILPNWCKWLSLAILITAFSIDFNSYKEGLMAGYNEREQLQLQVINPDAPPIPTPLPDSHAPQKPEPAQSPPYGDLLILLSIIVYILSKDKWEDDYINIIRARALITALLIISIIVMLICGLNGQISISILLLIQLLCYIATFKILKFRADI